MIRHLGVAALAVALAACTAQTGTAPPPSSTPTSTSTVTTTSPRIDTPRNVVGLDPCKLFTASDIKWRGFGTFSVAPAPYDKIPGMCAAVAGAGRPDDLVVLVGVVERAYEVEKANNPNGHQGLIDGHNVWFACGGTPENFSCASWASITPTHTLSVGLSQAGGDESRLLLATQGLITDVLARLPRAS